MKSREIAYIIFSFILTSTFISIFFFTYVASVESDIIKTQISDVINEFVKSTDIEIKTEKKNQIGKVIINSLNIPDMSEADDKAKKNNDDLFKKSIIVFGALIGIGVLAILIMWYFYRFNILEIVKYSFIILGLVALTEIVFVTFVTKNYRLIDKNYLSYLILTNLQKYANS